MELFLPRVAYAASDRFNQFLSNVNSLIVNPLIQLLFALAMVIFLYGMVEFIFSQTNEEKKTSGKSHMLWGVVGITIMLGVWTILSILLNTLGISDQIRVNNQDNKGDVQIRLNEYTPRPINR